MPAYDTVDDYIAAQAERVQPRLRELRAVFRESLPGSAEVISYGIPTYKLRRVSVHFGAAKRHCAVYGAAAHLMADELQGYIAPKGTVRFPLDEPIPADLVRKLLAITVAEREAAHKD